MARRTMPSDGPYKHGDEVFYWRQDSGKFKDKGRWIRGKVLSQDRSNGSYSHRQGSDTSESIKGKKRP